MKVQLIFNKANSEFTNIVVSTISGPRSLDEFDINVIDLTSDDLWTNVGDNHKEINALADFVSVKQMVERSKMCKVVFALPQNIRFRYCLHKGTDGTPKYEKSCVLKNQIHDLELILSNLIPGSNFF